MPVIQSAGCPINFEVEGPERAPVLMLSNSLGTTLHMWDDQAKPFTTHFRLVRYDRRGHGKSGVPKGPYSMEQLGRDALAVMDAVGAAKVNWCGLSMGGMVGMWLGAHAPERIDRLILSNTATYYPDKNLWADRIKAIRAGGIAAIADGGIDRWFTKDFQARDPKAVGRLKEMLLNTPLEGYVGCCEGIRDMDHREIIRKIAASTLVIAGQKDQATTVADGEFIRDRIPGARLAVLDAAHISNVEQAQAYSDTVLKFLAR